MTQSITALLLFTALTLALPVIVVLFRTFMILAKGKAVNAWPRDRENVDPSWVKRFADAHLNALENLPVFAAIVLGAAVAGRAGATEGLAIFVFYARAAQAVVHCISTSAIAVALRATFYVIQVVLMAIMLIKLLG